MRVAFEFSVAKSEQDRGKGKIETDAVPVDADRQRGESGEDQKTGDGVRE